MFCCIFTAFGSGSGLWDISILTIHGMLVNCLSVPFSFFFFPLFKKYVYFSLKDNCFTEFCCCLSNLSVNQPQVYIYPSLLKLPPISLPIPPLQVDTEPLFEFPEPYSKFLLAIYFTYGNVSFHVTLSICLTLSSPLPMSISLFSTSVSPLLPCK